MTLRPSNEAIKAVLSGIRRSIGTSTTRKAPATAELVKSLLAIMGDDLHGLRDRALLLLGFAGALRRSELVALDVADLEETAEGLLVHIRRSKTYKEGAGDFVSVPFGSRLLPVRALKDWLAAAGITEGPIFRPIRRGGKAVEAGRQGHGRDPASAGQYAEGRHDRRAKAFKQHAGEAFL